MLKSYKNMKKLFTKPLKALASPGIYLFGKYNQYKRERQETTAMMTPTENELSQLNSKIDKLLSKLNGKYVEIASTPEEECVICVNAKAVMQTYPCGHKVVCRRCFVKTIQIALTQRTLPLRCVICRAKILRLRQTQTCKLQPSYTFHSRSSSCSMSKKSSQLTSSGCSFKSNPWPSGSKYHSKSLPGINGNSFKYRSSVDRSYSTVVYRSNKSSNSIKRCCRSCSLSSYSSTRSQLQHVPVDDSQSTALKEDCVDKCVSQEVKDESYTKRKYPTTALSRDALIHQFQKDFHEGQTRPGPVRYKSFTLPTVRQTTAIVDVKVTVVSELSKYHSNGENRRTTLPDSANISKNTKKTGDDNCEENTASFKTKEKLKPCRLLKVEKKEKTIKISCNEKNNFKKEKKIDKKSFKVN